MTATFSTSTRVSHRYYMRKRKADIAQRILEMAAMIPEDVAEKAMFSREPDWPAMALWWIKIGVSDPLANFNKSDLAGVALEAHSLLPTEG